MLTKPLWYKCLLTFAHWRFRSRWRWWLYSASLLAFCRRSGQCHRNNNAQDQRQCTGIISFHRRQWRKSQCTTRTRRTASGATAVSTRAEVIIIGSISYYCVAGKSSDTVKISYVKISPDPPEKGQPFTVNAKVQLSKCKRAEYMACLLDSQQHFTVVFKCVLACLYLGQEVKGGTVQVYIKYRSFIPVVNKTYQLCDLARSVQDPCPLEAGAHEATIKQSFPSYSPSVSSW